MPAPSLSIPAWTKKIASSNGTVFQKKVWTAMLSIPKGKVATYGWIAKKIRQPRAGRAVGNACNANPFAPDVPCHRIVSSNGTLGGYAHGPVAKKKILITEGIRFAGEKILEAENVILK